MRISTLFFNLRGVNEILQNQEDLSQTQIQIATGKRILSPQYDPAGAARVVDLEGFLRENEAFQSNIQFAESRNRLEETALLSSKNVLQRARELVVSSANSTISGPQRSAISQEMAQLTEEIFRLANTKDSNNEFLFSGSLGNTQPFSNNGAGVFSYNGDETRRNLQVGAARRIQDGDPGSDVFFNIKNGNGVFTSQAAATNTGEGVIDNGTVLNVAAFPTDTFTISIVDNAGVLSFNVDGAATGSVIVNQPLSALQTTARFSGIEVTLTGTPAIGDTFTVANSNNQDVFTTIDTFRQALDTFAATGNSTEFDNAVNRALGDMDQALDHILNVRSGVGARLNAVTTQENINADFVLQVESTLSDVRDLDIGEAASRLNLQVVALQAAQQSFLRVQNLSLFNFL